MRSRIPKVLHPLAGRSLIDHVLDALADAGIPRPVVVTGHGADAVEAALAGRADTVRQVPQRGTADAVRVGLAAVPDGVDTVLVTMGDAPLQPASLFRSILGDRAAADAAVVLVSAVLPDATGYGRVVRGADEEAIAIVEEPDADEATRAIAEINVGTYAFDAAWLRTALGRVAPSSSGELYLTDLIALAVADGRAARIVRAKDAGDTIGINDRAGLAAAEERMRRRIVDEHLRNGVTIVDPATT